jgi:hypothetical protein
MLSVLRVKDWLASLDPNGDVAVDGGGLNLVELDKEGKPTEAYLELGGIPDEDDPEAGEGDPAD